MKTRKNISNLALLSAIIALFSACSNRGGEKIQANQAGEVKDIAFDKVYMVQQSESMLAWEGYKPTGQHHGTIDLTEGSIMLKDGMITGGKFRFDMNSITVLDLTDPEWNGKLTRHLKSPDFFEVDTHPEASFEITGVQPVQALSTETDEESGVIMPTHAITGNLTIKGIAKSITFDARIDHSDDMVLAETELFHLDRTEWNVQYKSRKISAKFKDDFIHDEMGIRLKIVGVPLNDEMASL